MFSYLVDVLDIMGNLVLLLAYIVYLNYYLAPGMVLELAGIAYILLKYKKQLTVSRMLDLKHKSPVYVMFSTTLSGMLPIKLYK